MSTRQVYLRLGQYMPALRQRIANLSEGQDPAPWAFTVEERAAGDDMTPERRIAAISRRANKTLFRAMLTDSLRGWFIEGGDRWQIPGWAWADQGGDKNCLIQGNDFLHPLLPPEIRRWSRREVLIDQAEFEKWLESPELEDQTSFPDLPPAYDEERRVAHVTEQDPPDTPNVSLAHAVSWLAFGISLDATTLLFALSIDALGSDPNAVDQKMKEATDRLVTAGTGGLPFWGKFVPNGGDESAPMTEPINAVRLEDFRQFDVLHDGLRYGTGLLLDLTQHNMVALNRVFPSPGHRYIDVKVERAALMAAFPFPARKLGTGLTHTNPMANDEVETWCREWLAGGHGNTKPHNGEDKAWSTFKFLCRAKGLSRDDVFRPAFKKAKTTAKTID